MEYKGSGYIDKGFALRHLKANLEHFKSMSMLPKEALPTKMDCEEEIKSIELILNSSEVLDRYIEAWNEAIEALKNIRSAASEYGRTVESLFGIYYWS